MKNRYDDLPSIVKQSYSKAEVLRKLGIRPVGGNYKTLTFKMKELGLDTSHFTGQGWSKGVSNPNPRKKPLDEVLVEDSIYSTSKLRQRLISEGYKDAKCESCGLSDWMGKDIPLELDHINGINTDHRIDNLKILCPNCHAQTHNYRGKNKKSALSEKRGVEYRKFRETSAHSGGGNPEPSPLREGAETRHGTPKSKPCLRCGNPIRAGKKYCSYECSRAVMRKDIPSEKELMDTFKEKKNFLQVGKYYGVSDNAVRKWCRSYDILDKVKG